LKNEAIQPGIIAVSTAGHDKDRVYLIIDCREKIATAVNGSNRGIEYPKKKRVKHLRILCAVDRIELMNEEIAGAPDIPGKNAIIRKLINDSINRNNKK